METKASNLSCVRIRRITANDKDWEGIFVYGYPDYKRRKELWKELTFENNNLDVPMAFIGDFNDVIAQHEKITMLSWTWSYKGQNTYGFSNPRNGFVTKERIDRVIANWEWRRAFQHATLSALPTINSDHTPLVLNVKPRGIRSRCFKFEAFWADHADCGNVIRRGWNNVCNSTVNHWTNSTRRMNNCKQKLIKWSKVNFKRVDVEIQKLMHNLKQAEEGEYSDRQQQKINTMKMQITRLWKQEEKVLGQRSRVKLLKFGDKNTAFFHASTIERRDGNRIERLKDTSGEWVCGENDILKLAVLHFQNLFKASRNLAVSECINKIHIRVTDDMNRELMKEVSDQEIKDATFSLGSLKAPGPDGLNGLFFKSIGQLLRKRFVKLLRVSFGKGPYQVASEILL
ncbi:hypothetical protein AHAS_Ahas14G0058800 [Arachis hypogaea]